MEFKDKLMNIRQLNLIFNQKQALQNVLSDVVLASENMNGAYARTLLIKINKASDYNNAARQLAALIVSIESAYRLATRKLKAVPDLAISIQEQFVVFEDQSRALVSRLNNAYEIWGRFERLNQREQLKASAAHREIKVDFESVKQSLLDLNKVMDRAVRVLRYRAEQPVEDWLMEQDNSDVIEKLNNVLLYTIRFSDLVDEISRYKDDIDSLLERLTPIETELYSAYNIIYDYRVYPDINEAYLSTLEDLIDVMMGVTEDLRSGAIAISDHHVHSLEKAQSLSDKAHDLTDKIMNKYK